MPSFDDVYSAEQDLQSGWHGDIKPFIPDPEMRRKFRSELLDVGQENMNRLGLFACRAAYEGGGEWLDQLIGYLAGNLALVRDFCTYFTFGN